MIALSVNLSLRSGKASLLWIMLTCVCVIPLGVPQLSQGQTRYETTLRSRAQLLGSEAKISFPERLVVTRSGQAYLLDTDLSTLFTMHNKEGRINRVCGSEALSAPADISVDRNGNVWVLSVVHSKIVKLTSSCQARAQIVSQHATSNSDQHGGRTHCLKRGRRTPV
jgi:hypothetical protein